MICPNCHGEVEETQATCSMCNYVLDYDILDVDRDFDEISRLRFLLSHDIKFLAKIVILSLIIVLTLFIFILYLGESTTKINYIFPILIITVCVALIVIVVRGKRRWK